MLKTPLSALVLAAFCNPVLAAGTDGKAPTTRVSYADLDLTRAEGREALDRRLKAAAVQVCRREFRGSVYMPVQMSSCVARTVADARLTATAAIANARGQFADDRQPDRLASGE